MPYEDEIARVPLFSELDESDIKRMGKVVVPRTFPKGSTIVNEGEQAVAFYIIRDGSVEIRKGGNSLATKKGGESFGEMALLDGYPRSTTIVALEDTECLVMTRWDFTAELRTNPSIALAMLPVLSKVIRRLEGEDIP
jgi:CRP/FNR family transcriptional regulator, cyclic AMP receptor protein